MVNLTKLAPEIVWKHFDEIRKIPRASKNEGKMRDYVENFAKKHNLECRKDEIGNIVVCRGAAPGKEHVPITVLQSHLDMVCEKDPEVQHDFEKDPIEVEQRGEYLYAKGTTLGADNGVGVALCLAALEDQDLNIGPLECFFTIDEETGLTGAKKFDPEMIKGRRLINLDSEEDGLIYVGCAGGGDTHLNFAVAYQDCPATHKCIKISVKGLLGGHSGCDIHLGRGNSVKILARVLWRLHQENAALINDIHGGDKHNAIPRWASAQIAVSPEQLQAVEKTVQEERDSVKKELGDVEPNFDIVVEDSNFDKVLSGESAEKILGLVKVLPHGVLAMNPDIPGMVNTSNNLSKVLCQDSQCTISTSSRSSIDNALEDVRASIAAAGKLVGANVKRNDSYPGWSPNLESPILKVVEKCYQETFGKAEILSIHAGLECGVIGKKIPGMDMVSIGPQIENPHSPRERVHIESVARTWKLLRQILQDLSE